MKGLRLLASRVLRPAASCKAKLLCDGFTALEATTAMVGRLLFADNSVTDLALVEGLLKQTLTALHPLELNLFLKILLLKELVVLAINLLR